MLANGFALAIQSSSGTAVRGPELRLWPSIRLLGICEFQRFEGRLLRLSRRCRRLRFGSETTDAFIKGYAARVDHANTLVLGYFAAGEKRRIALARRQMGERGRSSFQRGEALAINCAGSERRSWPR